jgi:hypothetical protein
LNESDSDGFSPRELVRRPIPHAFGLFLPFLDFHITQTIHGLVAPCEAKTVEFGIEHVISAGIAFQFDVIFPKLDWTSAFGTFPLGDILGPPKSGIHSRAFIQGHRLSPAGFFDY